MRESAFFSRVVRGLQINITVRVLVVLALFFTGYHDHWIWWSLDIMITGYHDLLHKWKNDPPILADHISISMITGYVTGYAITGYESHWT